MAGIVNHKLRVRVRFKSENVGSGREIEVCEEWLKRKVDVRCIGEVRWRGEGVVLGGKSNKDKGCFGLEMTPGTMWLDLSEGRIL